MNQTWENDKKTNSEPNFHPFGEFYLKQMLDIVTSYHFLQFQGKPMNLTQEKPHFGPDSDLRAQIQANKIFLKKICLHLLLDIMVSYHHVKY